MYTNIRHHVAPSYQFHYPPLLIFMGLLSFPVLYTYGNLAAIDAYFFGASASTESGLNTVDLKGLKLYQQLYLYFIHILTNMGFINILLVVARLHWFNKRLDSFGKPHIMMAGLPIRYPFEVRKTLRFRRELAHIICDSTSPRFLSHTDQLRY